MTYFLTQISDARFGGTYMTLLYTLFNLGYKWITTCALALLDVLTFKNCSDGSTNNCCTSNHLKVKYIQTKRIIVKQRRVFNDLLNIT